MGDIFLIAGVVWMVCIFGSVLINVQARSNFARFVTMIALAIITLGIGVVIKIIELIL